MPTKITILVPRLASNGIARAWILAQLLQRHYQVETLGFLRPEERVFPWFADYPWGEVRAAGLLEAVQRMERRITGDVVLAYRASTTSFAVGLWAKARRRIPLVLDMPEWEVHAHLKRPTRLRRGLMVARHLIGPGWRDPHSFKYHYLLDRLTGLADERLVCCTFLEQRYGGVLLPQGVDTARFDPARFDRGAVRRAWGMPADAKILFFGGNPQPRKGLEEILALIAALKATIDVRLVIVGRDESHPYTREIVERSRGKAVALGPQPFARMPELLAMADAVALPHANDPKARGYVPCKIYEAMAMELPVVASGLSDVPEILAGCGYAVPPDDEAALQTHLRRLLTHPDEARALGRRARARVVERYSWEVMDRILHRTIESLLSRTAPRPVGDPHRPA